MKKNALIVLLIVIIVILIGTTGYFYFKSNEIISNNNLNDNEKNSNNNLTTGDSNVGSFGSTNIVIGYGRENFLQYSFDFGIKINDDGSLTGVMDAASAEMLHLNNNSITIKGINEKIIRIIKRESCDSANFDIVVLSESGNVYIYSSNGEFDLNGIFDFNKINSSFKIYGIDLVDSTDDISYCEYKAIVYDKNGNKFDIDFSDNKIIS